MYRCQQNLLNPAQFETRVLEVLCEQSNKLMNCTTYLFRQAFFTFGVVITDIFEAQSFLKNNPHCKRLYSQSAQKVIETVGESFKSFKELREKFFKGELKDEPKLPNYRKKNGLAQITYPKQALQFNKNKREVRLPLGKEFKDNFGFKEIWIDFPSNLNFDNIKELRIIPRNLAFYAEWVYKTHKKETDLDDQRILAIDPGLDNWLTCLSNVKRSFIIDGKKIKSQNQWYNKQVAKIKTGKDKDYWDEKLSRLAEKRNRQLKDSINKAARFIINFCLKNRIKKLVFGWNNRNKNAIELGKKNNQEFVQIPTARLKDRICQLCEEYGIEFIQTEEAYTSKASFLDNDTLFKFGEKPKDNQFSGKRVKRGLYRASNGKLINADLNGAGNIARKVSEQLGRDCLDLIKTCRDALTHPKRYSLDRLSRLYRQQSEATCFQTVA